MKFDDSVNGAVAIGFGLILILMSRNFPEVRQINFGPGLLPTLVGGGFVAAGTVLIARRLLAGQGKVIGWISVTHGENLNRRKALTGMALQIIAVMFFILTVDYLGFLIAMPIVLSSLIWWFERRPGRAIVAAIIGTITIHSFFYQVMSVPLPWGVLEPLAGRLTW